MASPGKKCSCRHCRIGMRCSHGSAELKLATRRHRHIVKGDLRSGREPPRTYTLPRMG